MSVKFTYDKRALDNIVSFMNSTPIVKIGILSDEYRQHPSKEWKNGKWVPWGRKSGPVRIGAIHEFGATIPNPDGPGTIKIPERSFLRSTMVNRKADFQASVSQNGNRIMNTIAKGKYLEVLGKFGAQWKNYILETFAMQGPGWQPLSDITLGKRRHVLSKKEKKSNPDAVARPSTKILWVTGALARSIWFEVRG